MVALAFDTHKAVKALKEAGADEALAEAVVATVGDAVGENIATKAKADISELRTEIAEVKVDIAARFETLYHRLWAMALGIIAVLTALIKFIP